MLTRKHAYMTSPSLNKTSSSLTDNGTSFGTFKSNQESSKE